MAGLNIPRNLSFRVDTLHVNKKNQVGRLQIDENGIYKGLPMMVLGEETQQKTYYDPKSIMDQITSPDSRFNKVMKQGKLYGEYGHPSFIGQGYSDSDKIQRLTTVDERYHSHLFTSFYTDTNARPGGPVVLRADLKPTGPYGATFKDSLDDPVMNTAFSLRAYVDTQMRPDGLKYRNVRSLVTFDTVGASGYATTDKANALGLESFASDEFHDYSIHIMENGNLLIDQVGLETFKNTDLNELFGTNDISRIVQSRTIVQAGPTLAENFPNVSARGLFHDLFKDM